MKRHANIVEYVEKQNLDRGDWLRLHLNALEAIGATDYGAAGCDLEFTYQGLEGVYEGTVHFPDCEPRRLERLWRRAKVLICQVGGMRAGSILLNNGRFETR